MNKKIFVLMFVMIFLVGNVSAIDWDNKLTYEDGNMTAVITNWFGFNPFGLADLGKATLTSHSTPTEIRNVMPGRNRAVMYYDFKNWSKYEGGLGEVTFTHIETGGNLKKAYYFAKAIYGDVNKTRYESVCESNILENKTEVQRCENKIVGYELVRSFIRWEKLENNDIPEGSNRIALITNVGSKDKIDGVWTIAGKKISKHAVWSSSLEVDLDLYYKFDESAGSVVSDFTGNFDGQAINMEDGDWIPGLLGNALRFGGTDEFVNTTFAKNYTVTDNVSINFWMLDDTWEGGRHGAITAGGIDIFDIREEGTDGIEYLMRDGAISNNPATTVDVADNNWNMITLVREDIWRLYVNSVSVSNVTNTITSTISISGLPFFIGAENTAGNVPLSFATVDIDEWGIWDRPLSFTEVVQLYNGGTGITPVALPVVNVTFPLNITYNTTQTILNYTVSASAVRCWASVDGGATNISDNDCTVNFTGLFSTVGLNTWTVYSNNSIGNEGQDSVSFTVDSGMELNLINPIDNFNTTNINITFTCNATDNLQLVNLTLLLDGVANITNSTVGSSMTLNETIALPEGVYFWTCRAEDNESFILTPANRTFTLHTTAPGLNILFPNITIPVFQEGSNITLNWSITEPGQDLSTHVLGCAYTYNGVTVNLNNAQCVSTNETSFLYVIGVNEVNMSVEDIFNITATNSSTWAIAIIENSQTFNNETIEGSTEQFVLNTSIRSGVQISIANLIYNGTNNVAVNSIQGDFTISTATIIIPNVDADSNVTFNWNITLTDSSQIALASNNQTVKNLVIDNCTTGTTLLFNYTMVDERNQTKLTNTTLEVDLRLLSLDRTVNVANFSREYDDVNPAAVCINLNFTNATIYSVDSTVRYEAIGYANEYYHIQNLTLRNSSIPQEITLFDLFGADSTEFQITFKDNNFVPIENALIQISRQYISEGVFKTVEIPQTDSNGQTVAHLVEKEVIYNILVTKNGIVLGTFNNVVAFCEDALVGSCFIFLNALESNTVVFDYDSEIGLVSSFSYKQTTRKLQFDFSTTDGGVKNITLIGLKMDQLGNNTVCTTSLLSAAGSLFCTVPASIGNETLIVDIFVNGDLRITNYIQAGRPFDIGDVGYFLMFFLVLSLALMMVESKTAVVVGVIIGFLSSILLSFIRGGILGVGSSVMWLIIVAIILIWKLNSQRQT